MRQQEAPSSILQLGLHPSLDAVLPSSHLSPAWMMPSPQLAQVEAVVSPSAAENLGKGMTCMLQLQRK